MRIRPYPHSLHDRFIDWRDLEAWDRPIDAVLWVRRSSDVWSSGWALIGGGEICVTAGLDPADGYATLLHELAHLDSPPTGRVHHTAAWKAALLRAAGEVLGEPVEPRSMDHRSVHRAVVEAFALRMDLGHP